MKLKFIAVLLLYGVSTGSSAKNFHDARQSLKKWGFAYCVSELSNSLALKTEADQTVGAYFQFGQHASENAYTNVRRHIKQEIQNKALLNKQNGKPMPLVTCLNILDASSYNLVIRQQDRYISH